MKNQMMNSDSIYPDFFARFYDNTYNDLRTDDQDYFLQKISMSRGPVLEIGVGTGRFFIKALKSGADIYGIDISPEMLHVLLKKIPPKEHTRVFIDDIRTLNLNKKFDLIVAPFRVFQHLMTPQDHIAALNNAYGHLKPGGRFIFDLFVPNVKLLHEGLKKYMDFNGEYEVGKKIRRFTSMRADVVNQISHVTFTFVWDEDGKEISKEWKTSMRFLFRYELELLIQASKFEHYSIYGDFMEHGLSENSKEFLVECRK